MERLSRQLIYNNALGLHMRPAAGVALIASRYAVEAYIHKGDRRASVQSILEMLLLEVRRGDLLEIAVWGHDAEKVLDEICDFLDSCRDVEVGPDMSVGQEPDSCVA